MMRAERTTSMMRRRGPGSGGPPLYAVAVDLGSARVKLWAPDRRGPVEVRTAEGDRTVLVRRGASVDVAAIASLLDG